MKIEDQLTHQEVKDIRETSNYYGGVVVAEKNGKFYWAISNYDGILDWEWEEIPESLYKELLQFENNRP